VREEGLGAIPESQTVRLSLNPGATREIVLGGKGRPVIGRIVVNGYERRINWRNDVHSMDLIVPEPTGLPTWEVLDKEYSEALSAAKTDEERTAVKTRNEQRRKALVAQWQAFYSSEAGRQYWLAAHRYVLNFSRDGSFRIEDVPGGKYRLAIDCAQVAPQRGLGQSHRSHTNCRNK